MRLKQVDGMPKPLGLDLAFDGGDDEDDKEEEKEDDVKDDDVLAYVRDNDDYDDDTRVDASFEDFLCDGREGQFLCAAVPLGDAVLTSPASAAQGFARAGAGDSQVRQTDTED
jgi:hypothetical protein